MIGNQEVILLSRSEKHTIFVGARSGTYRNVKVSLVRASDVERGTRKFKLASVSPQISFDGHWIPYFCVR